MPWIENCAVTDIPKGYHHDAGPNSMLIQIMDPPGDFPTPKYKFKEVHQFEFLDVDGDCMSNTGSGEMEDMSDWAITQGQAVELVRLLKHAFENRMNVVVHCFAGLCRSGAVVEVGTHMGFAAVEKFRSPNTRVMSFMMAELGLPYDAQEHNWREDYRKFLGAKFD